MSAVPGPRGPSGVPPATPPSTERPSGLPGSPTGDAAVPAQRTAADVYRVSEEQVHRARVAVARNAVDPDDCRELLDMLGLMGEAGDPPPVRR